MHLLLTQDTTTMLAPTLTPPLLRTSWTFALEEVALSQLSSSLLAFQVEVFDYQ
jgi:hypothetical protein